MKASFVRGALWAVLICCTTSTFSQDGILDLTFGQGGVVRPDLPEFTRAYSQVVLSRPDGRLIIAGNVVLGKDVPLFPYDTYLFQYLEDGSPDTTFGMGGRVLEKPSPYTDLITAAALQADGKLVVTGYFTKTINQDNSPNTNLYVSRYLTDGTPDPGFGMSGRISAQIGTGTDIPTQVALQADGKILIGGYYFNGRILEGFLFRFLPDGLPDPDFGHKGLVYQRFPGQSVGNNVQTMLLQADGKLITAGYYFNDQLVIRYQANGARDSSFADNGVLQFNIGEPRASIKEGVLRSDGSMLLVINIQKGASINSPRSSVLVRVDQNGLVDTTFGSAGIHLLDPPDAQLFVEEMRQQVDGKLLLTGWIKPGTQPDQDGMVMRLLPDLRPDTTFGQAGMVTFRAGPDNNVGRSLSFQEDGKILVAADHFQPILFDYRYQPFLIRLENEKPLWLQPQLAAVKDFRVFPNPATERARLQYHLEEPEMVSIRLYDLNGRMIRSIAEHEPQAAGRQERELVFSPGMAAGAYLISIRTRQGSSVVKVFKK